MTERARPRPADFTDYHDFVAAMIDYLRATNKRFSYRSFCRRSGIRSPGYVKQVADGQRNLSVASLGKFARGFGLDAPETRAFELLFQLSTTSSPQEQQRIQHQIEEVSLPPGQVEELNASGQAAYAPWCAMAIREMLLLPDFDENPRWIARRLLPSADTGLVRRALNVLEESGLVERGPDGRLRSRSNHLQTPRKFLSLAARSYHRTMLRFALKALDGLDVDQRHISSVTFAMNRAQYESACARIDAFRGQLMEDMAAHESTEPPAEVYYLGIQLLPVTHSGT